MSLDIAQVKKVATLASLPLTSSEEEKFAQELNETLEYVKKLEQVDTKGTEPTNQVTGLINVTREDVVKPSLTQAEALQNAKSSYKGFIKVKAILGESI